MIKRRTVRRLSVIALSIACAVSSSRAADVEKKFRLALSFSGSNAAAKIASESTNDMLILDNRGVGVDLLSDPRNDLGAFGSLGMRPSYGLRATVAYNFTRYLGLEAGVGYERGKVGQVELQAQFIGTVVPSNQEFGFSVFRFDAGTITRIPLSVTAFARFRPDAVLNPYLGVGVGYTYVGFDSSQELKDISANMDRSVGAIARLGGILGGHTLAAPSEDQLRDLSGATVSAPDTFEWHTRGGMEWTFNKRVAAFVEVQYTFASRSLDLRFNGYENFGIPVPNTVVRGTDPLANGVFGPMQITQGGLIDGGMLVPDDPSLPADSCSLPGSACHFDLKQKDGVLDLGSYYVQGGKLKYGGWSAHLGVKITF